MNVEQIIINGKCFGCGACIAVCEHGALRLFCNLEGFIQPTVDASLCTHCGRCLNVCPTRTTIIPNTTSFSPRSYAAWNLDSKIRSSSSSGGLFHALANYIISIGGYVAGAALDKDLLCSHSLASSKDSMLIMMGSKYIQSTIYPDIFRRTRTHLINGDPVLFSGTPCQIAALRNFLNQDYNHLYCCDILCHGVGSHRWFYRYLSESVADYKDISCYSFRSKVTGWKSFSTRIVWNNNRSISLSTWSNSYMISYLRNYCLRDSCYSCPFASTFRLGDITLGDFWGVSRFYPHFDKDDAGTSLVIANNEKALSLLSNISDCIHYAIVDLNNALPGNSILTHPVDRPQERNYFFHDLRILSYKKFLRKYKLDPSLLSVNYMSIVKKVIKHLKHIFVSFLLAY